jgi:hypothetical protein
MKRKVEIAITTGNHVVIKGEFAKVSKISKK